jgi:hypothetical protein
MASRSRSACTNGKANVIKFTLVQPKLRQRVSWWVGQGKASYYVLLGRRKGNINLLKECKHDTNVRAQGKAKTERKSFSDSARVDHDFAKVDTAKNATPDVLECSIRERAEKQCFKWKNPFLIPQRNLCRYRQCGTQDSLLFSETSFTPTHQPIPTFFSTAFECEQR